jgi:aspartate 1-decarboxylase
MLIEVLKSKIHRVTITEANLHYVGSLTLDADLMAAANMIEGEKVQIVNVNNGERIETYLIKGKAGSGVVCLNGPAARRGAVGDLVVIISYAQMDFEVAKQFQPWVVLRLCKLPQHEQKTGFHTAIHSLSRHWYFSGVVELAADSCR